MKKKANNPLLVRFRAETPQQGAKKRATDVSDDIKMRTWESRYDVPSPCCITKPQQGGNRLFQMLSSMYSTVLTVVTDLRNQGSPRQSSQCTHNDVDQLSSFISPFTTEYDMTMSPLLIPMDRTFLGSFIGQPGFSKPSMISLSSESRTEGSN